jgi:hypothetical protein
MAIDDDSNGDGGGGTWDASRSIDDVAEAHQISGASGFGPSPPPGDIGPFSDRKVGHYTQVDVASARVEPAASLGATTLVASDLGRNSFSLTTQPRRTQRR